jgi:anti-sigma regulatory factor (Ser/Thr protein kinase)
LVSLALHLVPGLEAVTEARQGVTRLLQASFTTSMIEDAAVITSELVTNSLRHVDHGADDTIDVEADLTDQGLHLQVQDCGPGYEWSGQLDPLGAGGWGLVIVDQLADRWGTFRDPCRTWFEIDAQPQPRTFDPR